MQVSAAFTLVMLGVVVLKLVDTDADVRAGAAVAVVLAQVEHASAPRHLHVERGRGLEALGPGLFAARSEGARVPLELLDLQAQGPVVDAAHALVPIEQHEELGVDRRAVLGARAG